MNGAVDEWRSSQHGWRFRGKASRKIGDVEVKCLPPGNGRPTRKVSTSV